MDGFKLYVSNSWTIPPHGYDLCYQDPAGYPYPALTQTISCNQLGQYVIYYDDVPARGENGSVIELCYVAINGCKKNFWGINCNNSCTESCIEKHCYPGNGSCVLGCNTKSCMNDVCDKSTAICTNGCKERRTGFFCNKYNLAYDGVISQIPSGSKPANQANDGNQTSCLETVGTNVRFQVDLNNINIVTNIYLTSKVNSTVKGLVHKFYASNSSGDPEKGSILYQGEYLPRYLSVSSVFRYFTYIPSIKSALVHLEICEIGIVGCPSTKYGPLCSKACPENCHGPCELETGRCIFGCSNGWIGVNCEQTCSSGFYGSECLQNCSINCLISSCLHTTGECVGGCNSGWTGFDCTQETPALQTELNGAAIGGSIGVVVTVILIMLAGLIIYKKRKEKRKTQSRNEQQQYEDVRMENESTYQDLTTRSTSNEYDQINAAYVN
ncbi:cell death abnormality protein 1-like [Mytilus edulis]|uniref:cell death abnormality protein 1-like n=1 Tax=Mytilus edulis TaxID=6550 RepID=UPI0039F11485